MCKILLSALALALVNAGDVNQRLCSVNSVAGCNTHSMCAHLTNGQCEQHDGQCGYQCSCKAGWEGDKCDQKMACDTDLCNGQGTIEGNKVDGCTCACDEGFGGDRCEVAADMEFVVVDEAANGVDGTGWSNTKVGTGYQHHRNTNMHGPWGNDVRSVERTFQIGSNTCGAQCTVSWVQYGEHTRDNEWDRVYVNDVEVGSEQMYHTTRTQKAGTWTGACSNALKLRFTSDLDQHLADEGWGFGGVKVVRHACTAESVLIDETANGVDGTGWSNTKVGTGYQHHRNTNMHGPWGNDVRSVERTFQIGSNTCGAQCTVSWVQYGEHTRDNEWDRVYVNDVEVGSEQMYHTTRTQKAGTWTGACSNALKLRFTSDLDQHLADEGWGFGGVKVVRDACPQESATKWDLGMNINPSDGHNFGWGAEWDDTLNVGSDSQAFNQDYKKQDVWAGVPVKYIAIVRHDGAKCQASKVWKLDDQTKTMYDWLKDENPGRHRVTSSGPVSKDVPADLPSKTIDPIFATNGKLIFNWWYSNNGARIAVDDTYVHGALPSTGDNSDDLHGLGNEFGANTQSGQGSSSWWHDVSVVQPDCHGTPCKVQGTDHGTSLRNGDVSFSYAIYVSDSGASTASFPCQGKTLARAYSGRWQKLCTSCDYNHNSSPETYIGTMSLDACKRKCDESSTCTAIDFGKNGRANQCYLNTQKSIGWGSHGDFDAYNRA
eukprot:g230.t1